MHRDTLSCIASVEKLEEVISFIEDCADHSKLDMKRKMGLLIAAEEAFVNVCSYAYPDGLGEVLVSCAFSNTEFEVEVADFGREFDVLSIPEPDTESDIMDRQIGGLGVHFIRKLSDEASYRREHGQNILKMKINLAFNSDII
jgi:anti-sigma regulatory factor (Ser/Thr protein kinase)